MIKAKGGEMMRKRTLGLLTVVVAFSFLISGCVYFQATKEMKNASQLLSQLKGADGAKKVPYEYCSAEKLLEASNKEFAHGDYPSARDFAIKSQSAARAGLSQAK
jgi:hypothetical protein